MTEAWIAFETEIGRGSGHLRLIDGQAWTLLTTLDELKGHEQGARAAPPQGRRSTAPTPSGETWLETRERRGRRARPHDAAVRGDHRRGTGRDRARRAAAPAAGPDDHRRAQRAPRRLMAQALQVAVPARSGLVRPSAVREVPAELAGVLAQGQDRRLARDVHAGDGAQLLELHDRERARYDEDAGEWISSSNGTAEEITLRPKQLVLATGMSGRPYTPRFPGLDIFKGDQHHSSAHPGPDAYARQAGGRGRLQQLGARHLRRAVGARRRRDDGAAVLHPHRPLRHADGGRARRAVLRGGGRRRGDHREGRPDLRLASLPDHGRAPDPGLRARSASATPTSTSGWSGPASSTTGARTARACS